MLCLPAMTPHSYSQAMTDKQLVIETVKRCPDDASVEQITGELEILAAIRKGQEDVRAGRVKLHAEVEKMLDSWISK